MLEFSNQVAHVCLSTGKSPADIEEMVKKAAVVTHERGNRRFHEWLFEVRKNRVERMSLFEEVVVHRNGQKPFTMHEECSDCLGLSCKKCGWTGEVKVVYS